MPNWIEGYMKIRGKSKDVYRFVSNGFELKKYKYIKDEDGVYKEVVEEISVNGFDSRFTRIDEENFYANIWLLDKSHIKGTRRAFINNEKVIFIDDFSSEKEMTISIPIKQAWGFFENDYKKISDEYDVDIRLIGWECGMMFKQEAEILRGCDPVCKETKYRDWEWGAECPDFGG